MNKKIRILVNVLSSGGQVVLIGITYFFLYRYLLKQIGVDQLGVWSVVMATSSLANFANFGVSTSVVRFVALFVLEKRVEKINNLIFTASIFTFSLFVILALIIFPFIDYILKFSIDTKYCGMAINIVPYSLLCLIINALAGVYASVLDGLQKNYVRSILFSTSAVLFYLATLWLTPRFGLRGVVYAQIIQSLFVFFSCLAVVIKVSKFDISKWQWDKPIFKEIFSYGIKFQFTSLTTMFNEPVTKLLLSRFAGLAFTGYYEMANRLIMQLRGVIVSATQSLMPLMVKKDGDQSSGNVYKFASIGVAFISLFSFTITILLSETISTIWIGHNESIFIQNVLLISVSTFVNLLSAPAYFAYLSEGKLNPIIVTQAICTILNAILGYLLGMSFNGTGVVFAWIIAVTLGSLYLIIHYNNKHDIIFLYEYRKIFYLIAICSFSLIGIKFFFFEHRINIFPLEASLSIVILVIYILGFIYKCNKLTLYKKYR